MSGHRKTLEAPGLPGYEPEIGRWLWAMEEVRRGLLETVRGLDQATLDWEGPNGDENAIGSLLYHVAAVEMGWLFFDILGQDLPPAVEDDLPYGLADASGRLVRVLGVPLGEHLARLRRCRAIFLDAFRTMSLDDWKRLRAPEGEDYRVTPEWAVFHLVEHEAGHLYQIRRLKRQAKRYRSQG